MSFAALALLMACCSRGRAAPAQGRHQRDGRHHADARQLAGHALRMATQSLRAGRACYVLSLFVWIFALSVPVSIAYPLLSVGYVLNAIAAHFLFGEAVTATRWLGIGFIVIGVWLVARS
jgi:drug/metabolite transporter (DMT)-like permease